MQKSSWLAQFRALRRVAIWAKEQPHACAVLGAIFFALSLIVGVAWAAGMDAEPVAYLLGLCSSVFFALPAIANVILPERKPVREMTYEETLSFLLETDSKADWKRFTTDWATEIFLKEDPRLRIRCRNDDSGVHTQNFQEKWANKYPDPSAVSFYYDLFYADALIERFILVAIDGFRAYLPLPSPNSDQVPVLRYKVASICDPLGTLDQYMRRSGLRVENAELHNPASVEN